MERTKVKSSNLVSVGYDAFTRVLEVEFKGGSIYRYGPCPPELFNGLLEAESKGSYFSKNIKGVLSFEKMYDGTTGQRQD